MTRSQRAHRATIRKSLADIHRQLLAAGVEAVFMDDAHTDPGIVIDREPGNGHIVIGLQEEDLVVNVRNHQRAVHHNIPMSFPDKIDIIRRLIEECQEKQ